MTRSPGWMLAALLLLAGTPSWAASAARSAAGAESLPMPDDYRTLCAPCHGLDADGNGPAAATLPLPAGSLRGRALRERSDEELTAAIRDGGRGTGRTPAMPAFGAALGRQRTAAIVRYLRSLPDDAGAAPRRQDGRQLFEGLGCAGCHAVSGIAPRQGAPDLGTATTRLRPSFLLSYLRKPTQVRPLGSPPMSLSRMPGFGLTEADARDIATALAGDGASGATGKPDPGVVASFGCLACHRMGAAPGGAVGPDLGLAPSRLRASAVEDAVRGRTPMPAQRIAAADVRRLQLALLGGQRPEPFRVGAPGRGRLLLEDLACAACHPIPGLDPPAPPGPDLTRAGERYGRRFLAKYLAGPVPRRPGGDARMPDFRLSPAEVEALAAFLVEEREPPAALPLALDTAPGGTPREVERGREIWQSERCGTCHEMGGVRPAEGPRLGPALDGLDDRFTWEGVARWILDPARQAPGVRAGELCPPSPPGQDGLARAAALRAFLWSPAPSPR